MAWKFNIFSGTLDYFQPDTDTEGEINTASNLTSGSGTEAKSFKSKVGVNLQFRSIKQGLGVTVVENDNDITIASDLQDLSSYSQTDTIVENRRFFAYMNSGVATDWYTEQGSDLYDSRARWDLVCREQIFTNNFNIKTEVLGPAWVAPFACSVKGFTAIGAITSGDHDWEANLLWHDATYPMTGLATTFTSLSVQGTTGALDGESNKLTGHCDQLLAAGDLVLVAVRRDGYTTPEQLHGTVSFIMERVI